MGLVKTLFLFGVSAAAPAAQFEVATPPQFLHPPFFTNASTLYAPDVESAGTPPQVLAPPFYDNSGNNALHAPVLAQATPQVLAPPFQTNTSTLFAPVVSKEGDPFFADVIALMKFDTFADLNIAPSGYGFTTADVGLTTGSGGKFGEAVKGEASGNNGHLHGDTDSEWEVGNQDFTIEGWFYRADIGDAGAFPTIFGKWGGSSSDQSYVCFIDSSNKVGIAVAITGGSVLGAYLSSTSYPILAWNHIVMEREGDNLRLYMNGVMEAKHTGMSTTALQAGTTFGIGRYGSDRSFFNAGASNLKAVDEFRFTLGVARYASDAGYTVPIAPFPSS